MNRGFHQDALQSVVNLLRNEIYFCLLDRFTAAGHNLERKAHANVRCAFRGNVNVGFEIGVFINRCEQSLWRNIVTDVHRDVPDNTIEGSR